MCTERAVADEAPWRCRKELLANGRRDRLEIPDFFQRQRREFWGHPPRVGEKLRDGDPLLPLHPELRDDIRNRGCELNLASIDSPQYRCRSERLRNREEAANIIEARLATARAFGETDRLVEHDLPSPRDEHGRAIVVLVGDVRLYRLAQSPQAILIESEFGGFHDFPPAGCSAPS